MSKRWKFEVFWWVKQDGDRVLMKSMRPDEPAEFNEEFGFKIYHLCECVDLGDDAHIPENQLELLGSMTIDEIREKVKQESDRQLTARAEQ